MHRDRWVEQWKFLLRQDVQYFGVKENKPCSASWQTAMAVNSLLPEAIAKRVWT